MAKSARRYSERRQADRAVMAAGVAALADTLGAAFTVGQRGREVVVEIVHPSGARVFVGFDGASPQPDVHVITWNLYRDDGKRFHPSFGMVNPVHGHKASRVCYGYDDLLETLRSDLEAIGEGEAFV